MRRRFGALAALSAAMLLAQREPAPDERSQVEQAAPAAAPAKPKKQRKLLVVDLNIGRRGHLSIPYARLAIEAMARKTKAFEPVFSNDLAMLRPENLNQFDAIYLNNTIGDLFAEPAARDGLESFLSAGGGLAGHHAVTVTSTDWERFGEILGARGASHRMQDERVLVRVEDPASPLVKVFGGLPFEISDEIFRFERPYSRDNVRVLLSIDRDRTDMNQGRCFGACFRDDNDYPIAWIRAHGQGRVFYTTLGHNPHIFWNAKLLEFYLAGIQYALGDLEADATPSARR
jgi:type 1 glutamine amidotransferase